MVVAAGVLLAALAGVDDGVQRAAEKLGGVEAAVVVEVATGRVLARVGHVERALPVGSTFKIVDVIAAAAVRPASLGKTVRCEPGGSPQKAGGTLGCPWVPSGHGALDLEEALALSCNVWFGVLGIELGTPALLATARALGVTHLPPPTAPPARVADGEGVRMSALEMASLLRQVATGRRSGGAPLTDPLVLARLRRGLRGAVEHGTARRAATTAAPVAGKTGTTVVGKDAIGWFAGYAPSDAPTVVVVIAERRARGTDVARHAPPLLEAFFHGAAR